MYFFTEFDVEDERESAADSGEEGDSEESEGEEEEEGSESEGKMSDDDNQMEKNATNESGKG